MISIFSKIREYSSAEELRSDSEDGKYLHSVRRAVSSYRYFKDFKRDRRYNRILEHLTREQGAGYLKVLQDRNDGIFEEARQSLLKSDAIGNPRKYDFGTGFPLSPTTLRYLKVASDLKILFGDMGGMTVAEIGGGYGGQGLVCDTLFKTSEYHLFDLPDVNDLASKYLESFLLNGSYVSQTLNGFTPRDFDLVISNYAFSELPKVVEETYIRKVLSKSSRGYMTMNSGFGDHAGRSEKKLNIGELKAMLPEFEIFEEHPRTHKHNYIVAWGHLEGATLG